MSKSLLGRIGELVSLLQETTAELVANADGTPFGNLVRRLKVLRVQFELETLLDCKPEWSKPPMGDAVLSNAEKFSIQEQCKQYSGTKVFVVALLHEHGEDFATRTTMQAALEVASGFITGTLKELEDLLDGEDDDGGLAQLKDHLAKGEFERAVTMYNSLYEEFAENSEMHQLLIKETTLE